MLADLFDCAIIIYPMDLEMNLMVKYAVSHILVPRGGKDMQYPNNVSI